VRVCLLRVSEWERRKVRDAAGPSSLLDKWEQNLK
jgi:hypothetical protein